jgi:hypothetical protein
MSFIAMSFQFKRCRRSGANSASAAVTLDQRVDSRRALGLVRLMLKDAADRHRNSLGERSLRVGLAPFVHLVALRRHRGFFPLQRTPLHEKPALPPRCNHGSTSKAAAGIGFAFAAAISAYVLAAARAIAASRFESGCFDLARFVIFKRVPTTFARRRKASS